MRKNLPIPQYMCMPPPPDVAAAKSLWFMGDKEPNTKETLPPPPPRGTTSARGPSPPKPRKVEHQAAPEAKELREADEIPHIEAQQVGPMLQAAVQAPGKVDMQYLLVEATKMLQERPDQATPALMYRHCSDG